MLAREKSLSRSRSWTDPELGWSLDRAVLVAPDCKCEDFTLKLMIASELSVNDRDRMNKLGFLTSIEFVANFLATLPERYVIWPR